MSPKDHKMTILETIDAVGPEFAEQAAANDTGDAFARSNFETIRSHKMFSAMVPEELGGGGVSHSEMCAAIRKLATYCGVTALTYSMHSHLIAAAVFNYRNDKPGKPLLEKVAGGELMLISTGAGDWLSSNGEMTKVDGGFKLNARKNFASGVVMGDVMVTSSTYNDPLEGWQVLHFPVSMSADGVSVLDNWQVMSMRATGSNSIVLKDVFVPEEAVVLRRPKGEYHPVWNTILNVAMPLIMSAYMGVADQAAALARKFAHGKEYDGQLPYLLGEMENALTTAEIAWESMVAKANNGNFEANLETTNETLKRKTIVANAVMEVTHKALESTSGAGYHRALGMERLLRESLAGQYHPLQEKRQHHFSGRIAMGLDPVEVLAQS